MKIRKAIKEDAEKISNLIIETLAKVNSKDYSPEEIQLIQKYNSPEKIIEKLNEGNFFVLIEEGISGTVYLRGDKISRLYIKNDLIGFGIGGKLLKFTEDYARNQGVSKIWLNSTTTAKSFYHSKGYLIKKEFYEEVEGIKFKLIKMEKEL